jgi:hypothetical protein
MASRAVSRRLGELSSRPDAVVRTVQDGLVGDVAQVDIKSLPDLMRAERLDELPSQVSTGQSLPPSKKYGYVISSGGKSFGLSIKPKAAQSNRKGVQANADYLNDYLTGGMHVHDLMRLDWAFVLDDVLTRCITVPSTEQGIAQSLSPDDGFHRKILANGALDSVLDMHPNEKGKYLEAYGRVVGPFLLGCHQRVVDGQAARIAVGYLEGYQGKLNARILTKKTLDGLGYTADKLLEGDADQRERTAGDMLSRPWQDIFASNHLSRINKPYGDASSHHAVMDCLINHPDQRVREFYGGLREYHLPNVQKWCAKQKAHREPPAGWTEVTVGEGKEYRNFELGRAATGELIDVIVGKGIISPRGKVVPHSPDDLRIKTLEGVMQHPQLFDLIRQTKIRYGMTLAGMMANLYGDSPRKMLTDYLLNNPNPAVTKHFAGVKPYHFAQSEWTVADKEGLTMPAGWVKETETRDGQKAQVWRNYGLAREAMGELVGKSVYTEGLPLSDSEVIKRLEKVVGDFNKDYFDREIRFGATLGGMFAVVWGSSPSAALRDYLSNHPIDGVKNHFSGLRDYHFNIRGNWTQPYEPGREVPEGWVRAEVKEAGEMKQVLKNLGLSRAATGEAVMSYVNPSSEQLGDQELIRRLEGFINTAQQGEFVRKRIRFGATLAGMVQSVYGDSLVDCATDYLQHHEREAVRNHFKDLKDYHFPNATKWLQDGQKNYASARAMMKEVYETLTDPQGQGLTLENLPKSADIEVLRHTKVKYGCEPHGMLNVVYGTKPKDAVRDFIQSPQFEALVEEQPHLKSELQTKYGGSIETYRKYVLPKLA